MSGSEMRKRRRWLWPLIVAGGAAAATLIVAVLLALLVVRSPGGRRALLDRAAAVAAERGLHLDASDFALDLGRRRIAIERLVLAAPGSADRPFVVVERLEATLDPRTVVRGPLRILDLAVSAARVDLGAPFPTMPAEPANEAERSLPLTIDRLRLERLDVAGAPLESPTFPVESWSLGELAAAGSLDASGFTLVVERGELALEASPPAPGLHAALSGTLAGAPAGPFTIHDLELSGEGVAARASGTIGLVPEHPLELAFELDLAPERLVADAAGSRLRASGALDLRRLAGEVDLVAGAVPAELGERFVPPELWSRLDPAGTLLDAEARLRLDGRDRVEGTARLVWREQGEPASGAGEAAGAGVLLQVDAATVPDEAPALAADLDAVLLPSSPGERRAHARVRAPGWSELAAAELVSSNIDLALPDLRRAVSDLDRRFPALLPALPPALPLEGAVGLSAQAHGAVLDPEVSASAQWRLGTGDSVTVIALDASGRPLGSDAAPRRLSARAALEDLDLALLEPALERPLAGRVSGTVELDLAGDRLRARASLDGRAIVASPELRLDSLSVELAGTPQVLAIDRLAATIGETRVDASGRVALALGSERPLRSAEIRSVVTRPVDGVSRLAASLALESGVLRVEALEAATDFGVVHARAAVPLGSLRGVQALEEAIAALPTPLVGGPVELAVRAPGLDGAALLHRLGVEGPETLGGDLGLDLRLDPASPAAGAGTLSLQRAVAQRGTARIETAGPLVARLRDGVLTLEPVELRVADERVRVAAAIELATEWRAGDPIGSLVGPARVEAETRSLDAGALAAALGWEAPFDTLRAGAAAVRLALDPARPAQAAATIEVDSLEATLPEDHSLRLVEPLSARLDAGRLEIAPTRVEIDGQTLTLAADARLDPDWRPQRPPGELIASLDAALTGTLEADALEPWLAGVEAGGQLVLDLRAAGERGALTGRARLEPAASGAEILLRDPYFTRLRDPRLELRVEEGRLTVETASAELNEGTIRISGGGDLSTGTLDLAASLDDVRYRLDYGLMTEADGRLRLTRSAAGALRLEGRVVLDRGVLRRDLDPDREILRFLFAPEESAAPGPLDDLELELELATVDGVRIRNNLADLRASWAPLTIGGTLGAPRVEGAIDLDPGGYLFAYGQTVRVDEGRLELAGDGSPPTVDLETTTSFEDPSVARAAPGGRTYLEGLLGPGDDQEPTAELDTAIARGLAGYYGERLARRLGEGLGGLDVSLRPILVFGLDNPGTELTFSRDLSAVVTAALSVSLREEGNQTYVAELHEIDTLPRFIGQLFTLQAESDDASERVRRAEGVLVQQRLQLGGAPREAGDGPRLRRIRIEAPKDVVSRRALRRRLGFEPGRRLERGAAFEAELETLELLHRRGYPGATVEVGLVEVEGRRGGGRERADLEIEIEPGPQVTFAFAGTEIHPRQERAIASIYRPDFLESASLDEMREQAERELRSLGHLAPEVEIRVVRAKGTSDAAEVADADDEAEAGAATRVGGQAGGSPTTAPGPDGEGASTERRRVRVDLRGGRRVRPLPPRVEGIDGEAAAAIAARFATVLDRVELVQRLAPAERRLRAALGDHGYPGAEVRSIRLEPVAGGDENALRPVVEIAAPPRHRIVEVSHHPALPALAAIAELPPVRALEGVPVSSERIARGALAIEDALHARGHARARVRSRLLPAPGDEHGRILRYEVDRADLYRLDSVEIAGAGATRPEWAAAVAGLEPGAPLDPFQVRAARRRLFETGLFRSVLPEIDYAGGADGAAAQPRAATVSFAVLERPRYEVAYGVLWQSDFGASVVVDAVDQNLLGRGVTLGARARYRDDDRNARVYSLLPRLAGTAGSLQLFAEVTEKEDQDESFLIDEERFEINLAAALPLERRLTARIYGRYLEIVDHVVDTDPVFPIPPFDIRFAWPSVGFQTVYEGRDDPVATRSGTFASVDLSAADDAIGSDFSYARLFARASHHRTLRLFGRRAVWAQASRLGLARAFRDQELLSFEHLFAGGEYSLRGYDERSIGPGVLEAVREQALLVINQELHVPLWRDLLAGVAFVDAGNVWQDLGSFGEDFLYSLGLGLRASTPVGLVRLDAAYPLDLLPGEERRRVKLYLGLGNTF